MECLKACMIEIILLVWINVPIIPMKVTYFANLALLLVITVIYLVQIAPFAQVGFTLRMSNAFQIVERGISLLWVEYVPIVDKLVETL